MATINLHRRQRIRGSYTDFNIWGPSLLRLNVPDKVMVREHESELEAVCRALGRRNRPICVANARHDGRGPSGPIYQLTMGKPARDGGFAVEGELWVRLGPGPALTKRELEVERAMEADRIAEEEAFERAMEA